MKIHTYKGSLAKLFVISSFILTISLFSTSAFTSGGNMENGGTSYIGSTLVITGQSAVPASYCNRTYAQYRAVMIDPEGGETSLTEVGIPAGMDVNPGSRFMVVAQNPCGGNRLNLEIEKR